MKTERQFNEVIDGVIEKCGKIGGAEFPGARVKLPATPNDANGF
jgi:hypothetical protein